MHFHPPGSLRLPTTREVTPMDLMTRMIEHHVWLTGEMLDRAARLTDEQLDAPIEVPIGTIDDDMTHPLGAAAGSSASSPSGTPRPTQRSYDWDQERGKSVTTLRRELAEEGPAFLAQVRTTVEEGRLDDTFVDVTCEPPRVFTYGGMIAHVLTFAAVRRLVVLGAFETLGITDLDAGDPAQWVAEPAEAGLGLAQHQHRLRLQLQRAAGHDRGADGELGVGRQHDLAVVHPLVVAGASA